MSKNYPPVEIRPLTTRAELQACVDLQRETWGDAFTDVVPTSILKVSQRVGSIAAGAFDPSGRLLGFVYGITGVEAGRIVHWSDMLAVRPEARNLGLGRSLKEYQRARVREMGGEVIYWTYDPLVARNAHINFNVFGVRVVEYVEDMYGDTDSLLHSGIGTDRFVVAWAVTPKPTANAPRTTPDLRIEIPTDINALQISAPAEALSWRKRTRPEFQRALADGLSIVGFTIDDAADRGYYLLSRG